MYAAGFASQHQPPGRESVVQRQQAILALLFSLGVDPNWADGEGRPLIALALDAGCEPGVFRTLVEHGADVNVVVSEWGGDATPLDIARSRDLPDIVKVLRTLGGKPLGRGRQRKG